MSGTLFADGQIVAFTVLLAISVLVPIIMFVWYYMKKKAKLASYFIGFVGTVLMVAGKYLLDTFFVSMLGLGEYLDPKIHPVYTALYAAVTTGLLMIISTYVIMKFAMDGREGKENALLLLIGKAGLYLVMYGAVTELTYMSVANTVNDMGLDKYISQLSDPAIRDSQRIAVQALASRPVMEIVTEGILQVLLFVLHIALGILVYMRMHKSKDVLSNEKLEHIKKEGRDIAWYEKRREGMLSLAIIVQVLSLIPFCLLQVNIGIDLAILYLLADIILALAAGFGSYAMYKQLK